jgi:hypothetical protein
MTVDNMEERLREVELQISTHEAVCAERYAGILAAHKSMTEKSDYTNRLLIGLGVSLLGGMAVILVHQVFFK